MRPAGSTDGGARTSVRQVSRDNTHHILNASSNLLGICFVIITALKVTHLSRDTYADEISTAASVEFICACVLSYMSLRSTRQSLKYEKLADYIL